MITSDIIRSEIDTVMADYLNNRYDDVYYSRTSDDLHAFMMETAVNIDRQDLVNFIWDNKLSDRIGWGLNQHDPKPAPQFMRNGYIRQNEIYTYTTCMVIMALLRAHERYGDERFLSSAQDACNYIINKIGINKDGFVNYGDSEDWKLSNIPNVTGLFMCISRQLNNDIKPLWDTLNSHKITSKFGINWNYTMLNKRTKKEEDLLHLGFVMYGYNTDELWETIVKTMDSNNDKALWGSAGWGYAPVLDIAIERNDAHIIDRALRKIMPLNKIPNFINSDAQCMRMLGMYCKSLSKYLLWAKAS